MTETAYWVFKTVSDKDISYKSIERYDDVLTAKYTYDNSVANSKQVKSGDIAVLINKDSVLGIARISRIKSFPGKKTRRRCPECASTNYEERKTKIPKYKCNKGHEFPEPDSEIVDVIKYEALYGGSFIKVDDEIGVRLIRPFFHRNYNRNMSIQSISHDFVINYLKDQAQSLSGLTYYPSPNTGIVEDERVEYGEYEPNEKDERPLAYRQIVQRRGQQKFRNKLRENYGDKCIITGCDILEIIEAAHIIPYKGKKDNHVSNGLLLRADIHTLFDLNLIGINPNDNKVYLNDQIDDSNYTQFAGKLIDFSSFKKQPSYKALIRRWEEFKSNE